MTTDVAAALLDVLAWTVPAAIITPLLGAALALRERNGR
jgi:hypothetical protein